MFEKQDKSNINGFTLIEILISLAILAVIALATTQAVQQSLKQKKQIQEKLDDGSRVRDALRLMEKDMAMAFHYRDTEKEVFEKMARLDPSILDSNNPASAQVSAPINPNEPPLNPNEPRPSGTSPAFDSNKFENKWRRDNPFRVTPDTHFVGTDDAVYFASRNASQMFSTKIQADFVYLGYFVTDCKSPQEEAKDSKCLMRSVNPVVDGDPKVLSSALPLLENITEFKLRYIGEGRTEWSSDWDSYQGAPTVKNRFPSAVEVSLTYERKVESKVKKLAFQMVFPIKHPNNSKEKTP